MRSSLVATDSDTQLVTQRWFHGHDLLNTLLPSVTGLLIGLIVAFAVVIEASAEEGNPLSYLTSNEVWFPHREFPKLTTPQWVGDPEVDCVVTLAIDDMRDTAKYEAFLRPILQRLKQIDGRAPVSIMTCQVKPEDQQLQEWLKEGLSLECHTADHPCPILGEGQFAKAKGTYDKCVDLISSIPNNQPVAFRTPCCDSLNTVSPRLFSEIINKTTSNGKFLQLDSSVFTLYTADDPSISRDLLFDADGKEKFRKYIPRKLARGNLVHDGFVNLIENYPYPYVIQNQCWEFPCMVPSDWSANHLHKPNNPDTVRDLKVALDITVQKQGVFNLVFHPHGWIKAEQVIDLIDHAVAKHGNKVKFLTFAESVQRLNKNVLRAKSLRGADGSDQCIRLADVNQDGFMDVLQINKKMSWSRNWDPVASKWNEYDLSHEPFLNRPEIPPQDWTRGWFSIQPSADSLRYEVVNANEGAITLDWNEAGKTWTCKLYASEPLLQLIEGKPVVAYPHDADWNGDGRVDRLTWLRRSKDGEFRLSTITSTSEQENKQQVVELPIPNINSFRHQNDISWDELARKRGARLIDLNQDGQLDLVVSNAAEYGVWLLYPTKPEQLLRVTRQDRRPDEIELPPIVMADESDNGFFVKDRSLCWINEATDTLPDFVVRIPFDSLLGDRLPEARSPRAAKQSMRVAPGYRVDLVAHEPQTMDPVALDWGPDGKLWVAEMADYPQGIDGKGKPGGRIRCLEDTDGDGEYEKSTLFLDDVPFPNGVTSWKKGVLVSAAPDIFYAEDTDGDGKADVKQVLFTGLAEGNQQHRANGFSRGLDNWLYLANGDSGGTVRVVGALVGPVPEGKMVDIRGRDLRIRPDTGDIEPVIGQTQFGRNRDDWGNWFGNNNSRPMWHYLLDDHYLQRNAFLVAPTPQRDVSIAPGASPVFPTSRTLTRFNDFHTANRFTSACSAMVYRDSVLGDDVTDGSMQIFVSEPVHNLVHRELMQPEGLSFTSRRAQTEEQSEFLTSTDNWFRPTQIKTGPDGALYVADMYRLVIEHPQWIPIEWQQRLDLRAGQDKGRIWRVAPTDKQLRAVFRLNKLSIPLLVAALSHANGWQRDLAQQLLIDRADASAIPLLVALATSRPSEANATTTDRGAKNKAQTLGRLHALCTLDGLSLHQSLREQARTALLNALPTALNDPDAGVRRHAVRLCDGFPKPNESLWQALVKTADDTDPQVRLQLAYTLGEIKHPQAGSLLGQIAVQGVATDPAHGLSNVLFDAAVISSLNSDNLEFVLAEVIKKGTEQTDLLQQLLGQATAFNHEAALVTLLNRATESADQHFERWQYNAVEQFLESLERRFTTLDKWLKELRPEARPVADRLQILFQSARTVAANNETPLEDRVAALRVLGRTSEPQADLELLTNLLTPRFPPELQSAALSTLARVKSDNVAQVLLASYRSLAPSLRTKASDVLLSRNVWRDELLAALESKQLSPADFDATIRQRLLEDKSPSTSARAAKVLAIDLNSDRAKLVAEYLPTVRAGGDPQHGSQLFKKMCSQCHKLGDVGHSVGPDLMSLTDKSPDAMVTAVLDPNRAVETKFLTFTAITKSGVTHTGLMAAETAQTITLRGAEGKETTLLRNELDELLSNAKSLMPEGLERDLKPADAAALIAYIRLNVPLPARKTFAGNEPRVVAADASGKFVLTPFEAEIYGSTIVLEEKHRNLGWWSSADDIVVWTIIVPQAGKYQVQWQYACDQSAAGNRVSIEAAGKSLSKKVEKTDGWDDYRTDSLGELELPAGEVRITIKPMSRPLPALADVKSIELTPQK
ncbi:MAG: putative rane-bound dehydrogenase [Schlesneria sp.]|nr:putative rane-bound dehydrogenase [Schlesneria sp.]